MFKKNVIQKDEKGMILIAVILGSLVIFGLLAAIMLNSQSNLQQSHRNQQYAQAGAIANEGIENGIWSVLNDVDNPNRKPTEDDRVKTWRCNSLSGKGKYRVRAEWLGSGGGEGGGGSISPIEEWEIHTDEESNIPETLDQSIACTINGKVYLFGGRHFVGTVSPTFEGFNGPDFLRGRWSRGGTPTVNIGYVEDNYRGYHMRTDVDWNTNSLYEYDPQTDRWETKSSGLNKRSRGTAVEYDGRMYVFGGVSSSGSDRVDVYDPASDSWESRSEWSMNNMIGGDGVGTITETTAVVVNDKIYLVGGNVTPQYSATPTASGYVYEFDPRGSPGNYWRKLGNPIQDKHGRPLNLRDSSIVAIDDDIYIIGGEYNNPRYSTSLVGTDSSKWIKHATRQMWRYRPGEGNGTTSTTTPKGGTLTNIPYLEDDPNTLYPENIIVFGLGDPTDELIIGKDTGGKIGIRHHERDPESFFLTYKNGGIGTATLGTRTTYQSYETRNAQTGTLLGYWNNHGISWGSGGGYSHSDGTHFYYWGTTYYDKNNNGVFNSDEEWKNSKYNRSTLRGTRPGLFGARAIASSNGKIYVVAGNNGLPRSCMDGPSGTVAVEDEYGGTWTPIVQFGRRTQWNPDWISRDGIHTNRQVYYDQSLNYKLWPGNSGSLNRWERKLYSFDLETGVWREEEALQTENIETNGGMHGYGICGASFVPIERIENGQKIISAMVIGGVAIHYRDPAHEYEGGYQNAWVVEGDDSRSGVQQKISGYAKARYKQISEFKIGSIPIGGEGSELFRITSSAEVPTTILGGLLGKVKREVSVIVALNPGDDSAFDYAVFSVGEQNYKGGGNPHEGYIVNDGSIHSNTSATINNSPHDIIEYGYYNDSPIIGTKQNPQNNSSYTGDIDFPELDLAYYRSVACYYHTEVSNVALPTGGAVTMVEANGGTVEFKGNLVGSGTLIIVGADFSFSGNSEFTGLIYVKKKKNIGGNFDIGGSSRITGGIIVEGEGTSIHGTERIFYSKVAMGTPHLKRTTQIVSGTWHEKQL